MWKYSRILFVSLALSISCCARLCNCANTIPQKPEPKLLLWAWERPEDLTFIDKERIGVAIFSQLISVKGNTIKVRPRQQPVRMPKGTFVVSVSRIETDRRSNAVPDNAVIPMLVDALLKDAANAPMIQIDFDARQNERPFYLELLRTLRSNLPVGKRVSVTALASWAVYDPWLPADLVDEVVPMFFQMGPTAPEVIAKLRSKTSLPYANALGVGAGSGQPILQWRREHEPGARVYAFSSTRWTPTLVDTTSRISE